jgi:hypothetical protein
MEETDEKWYCKLCEKHFTNRVNYWKHKNKTKTSCMPKEKVVEMLESSQTKDNKINYFEAKTKSQQSQIEKLETTIEQLLKINPDQLMTHVEKMGKNIEYTIQKTSEETKNRIDEIQMNNNTFYSTQNQIVINDNANNDTNNYFSLSLHPEGKEQLNHISKDLMMKILDHNRFNDSMKNLIAAVFFHPLAPRNMTWCVNDNTAQFGALEYNHETNSLITKQTTNVINKNVQNIMFRIVDLLEELRMTQTFNEYQSRNCSKMFSMIGNELEQNCVSEIKETAFKNRGLAKAIWGHLDIMIDKIELPAQRKLKSKPI